MPSRDRSAMMRVMVVAIVGAFLLVTTATTIISVGQYCLTSDGADTTLLPDLRR